MSFKPFEIIVLFVFLPLTVPGLSQSDDHNRAFRHLSERGEVIIRFDMSDLELEFLSRMVSIDQVHGDTVSAYANASEFREFLKLNTDFRVVEPPGRQLPDPHPSIRDNFSLSWDAYPSYDEYLEFMQDHAVNFPLLCRLDTIGESEEGRLLLALKISDNVHMDEAEPEFLFTSSMHGDEVTGYMLCLQLIDHLVSGYDVDPDIRQLVDTVEIFINPLANPDGTYAGGNASVSGATRYNANHIDLNRNFPDPQEGDHPDGAGWQAETRCMMDFHDRHYFSLSANYHGGAEVMNYPWDTWSRSHADEDWFIEICTRYADSAKMMAGPEYFTDVISGGVINGYDWYPVAGGRQDYVTYFCRGREVTIEVSSTKMPDPEEMSQYWQWNRSAMLNYIAASTYGIHGRVTDCESGLPVRAKIEVKDHDVDNSYVVSDSLNGEFHRFLPPGTYSLHISADGYLSLNTTDIDLAYYSSATWLDIELVPGYEGWADIPRQEKIKFFWSFPENTLWMHTDRHFDGRVIIYDVMGRKVLDSGQLYFATGVREICPAGLLLEGSYYCVALSGDRVLTRYQFSVVK